MKRTWIVASFCALHLCLAPCQAQSVNESSCVEISALARTARSRTLSQLIAEKLTAGNDYLARTVVASRLSELRPTDQRAAILLLDLIPQNGEQRLIWMTLGDSLCDSESISDMKSLGRLGENLPRNLAKAVLIAPDKMPNYVAFSLISVQDPHSDFAIQMQIVCRAEHSSFLRAVLALPSEEKVQFLKHVFNPKGCHALALPEAE